MRKIRLSDTDLELFDIEIRPTDYLFYQRHKDAFKTMWREQGKPFWARFQITFQSFTFKHGIIKQMDIDSPKFKNLLNQAFSFIHEHFVDGKDSTAKNFIDDVARLAQHQDKFPALDSKSFEKGPFFARDTRELFRKFFGLPDQKSSYLKVYLLSPVYLRFGGSVCRCLMRWMEAPQMDDPNDDSYWVPPQPSLVDKSRDDTIEITMCSNCVDDCGTSYFREKIMGSKKGPISLNFWTLGDPRFNDRENPLFAPHLNPGDDWRDLLTVEMFRDFYHFAKFKYGLPDDNCKECQLLKKNKEKEELIKDLKEVRYRIDELEEDGELHSDYEARIQDIIKDKPRVREALEKVGVRPPGALGFEKKDLESKFPPANSDDDDHVPDAIERDPYLLELYIKALSQGEEADTDIRVNIVGNYAQGKTSLAKRLIGETTEAVGSTNSVDIYRCQYANESNRILLCRKGSCEDDSEIVDRIVSVALSEKEKNIDSMRNSADAIFTHNAELLPFKLSMPSDKKTNDNNRKGKFDGRIDETDRKELFVREIHALRTVSQQTSPLESKRSAVTKEELTLFAQRLESNKQKDNVIGDIDIWDFGGQFIFYSTHTLFHSRRAIYILVFDLSLPLSEYVIDKEFPGDTENNRTMSFFAKFWMNSIHSYVGTDDGSEPHVILVGTHKDKLNGDESAKQKFKDEYFEKVRQLFEGTIMIMHIHSVDFAVDNNDTEDVGFSQIREEIIHLGTDRLKTVQIPARWIPLERSLKQIRNENIVTFDRIMELDSRNKFSLEDKEQVKLFLLYHHAKGTLFFFDEEPISAFVVLNTQYLIDAFKCIVTSERFCKKESSCRHLWTKLIKEARLEQELVEKVWKNDKDHDFHEHKNELLMFLQNHLIISEVSNYDETTSESTGLGWFIVPSFLKEPISENALHMFLNGKHQTSVRFVMRFYHSPVVQVVFYRLLAALIGRWSVLEVATPEIKSLIYENVGVLRLDKAHAGIIERKNESIELTVVCLCHTGSVDDKIPDHFRRFSESIVRHEFRKLRSSPLVHEEPFTRCIRCNDVTHAPNGSRLVTTLNEVHETENKSIPCPDMIHHDIFRDEVLCEWFQQDRVTEMTPDCQLNEKQLGKFAQIVGNNWELLAVELGLSQVEIQQISMDFQSSQMKIFKVLIKWKDTEKERATVNTLLRAMKNAKKVYVDWDEFRNICEKINLDQARM